jgi:hypothetical protein
MSVLQQFLPITFAVNLHTLLCFSSDEKKKETVDQVILMLHCETTLMRCIINFSRYARETHYFEEMIEKARRKTSKQKL